MKNGMQTEFFTVYTKMNQIVSAEIRQKSEDTKENDQDVSKISFQVSKADGDTYVLLVGSSEDSSEETEDASEDVQTR